MSNLLSSHPSPDTTLPVLSYCNHTVNSITQINMIYVSIVTDFKDSTLNSSVLLHIILLRLVRQIAFQAITCTQHDYCLGPNDSMPQWTDQNKGKQKPPFNLPEWQPEWQPPEQTNRRRQRAVKYAGGCCAPLWLLQQQDTTENEWVQSFQRFCVEKNSITLRKPNAV